jgi:hypothetical protein
MGGGFNEQEMCNRLSREFQVAVRESRKAGYMGYPIDDITNLICEPLNSRTSREQTYFDHGQIPVWFYPFLEVYQRERNLFLPT